MSLNAVASHSALAVLQQNSLNSKIKVTVAWLILETPRFPACHFLAPGCTFCTLGRQCHKPSFL